MVEVAPDSRQKILQIAQKLPTTPRILGLLQSILLDPNSGLDEICWLLKRDMALSARLIRISNSPYFGSAIPHASLEEAVCCVGYTEIYRLVGFAISFHFSNKDLRYYGYTSAQVWENTLVTALAMETLAKAVGSDPRHAYTAGLMRSMGKIVLEQVATETLPSDYTYPIQGQDGLSSWESGVFGCDNTAVTALLLDEWNFPNDTSKAILHHYNPEALLEAGETAYMLNLAGRIAQKLGCGLMGESHYWNPHPAKFIRARLAEADFAGCVAATKVAFDGMRQVFG